MICWCSHTKHVSKTTNNYMIFGIDTKKHYHWSI